MKRKKVKITIVYLMGMLLMNPYSSSAKTIRNPFKPQLPEKVEEQPLIPIEPPELTTPNDRMQQLQPPPEPVNRSVHVEPPNLNVTGLIWATDRPQAIINNQVVDIGDTLTDMEVQIVNIKKTGIEILFEGIQMMIKP